MSAYIDTFFRFYFGFSANVLGLNCCTVSQTWNLSKNLHRRIFRLKILHCQFHLISTVLVGKKTQKMSENGEIYTAASSNGMDKFHLCCPSMRSHTLKRWLKLFHRYHLVLVCLTVPTLYLPSFILVSGDYFGECIGEQIVFGKIVVA